MGDPDAKFVILGEGPSTEEEIAGKPFVGPSGRELDKILKDAGIPRHAAWITNVSKWAIPPNPRGKRIPLKTRAESVGIDLDQQVSELQIELRQLKPNCILALGGTALWALSGKTKISKFRGSIMHGMGSKFVPTYHPAHLLHQATAGEIKGYWNRFVMVLDFKRAWDQSKFPDLRLPFRNIQICRNSAELLDFKTRYHNVKRMAVDIEAGGTCIPICVGLAFNKHHAMVVPLWNFDGISSIPDSDLVACWKMLADMLWNKDIIGQNLNYDRDKLKRLGLAIRNFTSDIMYKSFAINPELPKGLAFNTSIYTEEPFYKDEGMYEGRMEDLLRGCGKDACVTIEIDEKMEPELDEIGQRQFYENFLMKLPDFYAEIENNGFNIDTEKRDELLKKYIEWDERLSYEMFKLVGVTVNSGSPQQVTELLFNVWKLPRREGTGEEELTALLNLKDGVPDPAHRRGIELILEQRRVRKTISTYLLGLPDFDGKMKTTCFPCNDTGRSSNGQQDPPIRPKIDIVGKGHKNDMKVMGAAFQTLTKHGDIGADVRIQYKPDKGHIYVQADSSQAEARVVFNLAGDEDALRDIDEHDYHALTASWFFGGTEDDYSKKRHGREVPIRFAGKTLRHSCHLGAGKRRAATEVNTQARKYKIEIAISESEAGKAIDIFHARQPRIRQVFHAGVIEALRETRFLIAPLPWNVDSPCGGRRMFFERWGDELFRQAFSYLPQRAVTDNTKAAGIRVKKQFPECKIILESHDALLFEIREEYLSDFVPIVRREMERPIDFSACSLPRRKLKIPCDIEVGYNYKELSKFKPLEVAA